MKNIGLVLEGGGIADPVPIAKSIGDGNSLNVVILTRHKGDRKSPSIFHKLVKTTF